MEIEVSHHDFPGELAASLKRRYGSRGISVKFISERKLGLNIDEECPEHLSARETLLIARDIEEEFEWVTHCSVVP